LRILRVHNFYQQPGGEDQCFSAEVSLLRAHGHEVFVYTVHNDQIKEMNRFRLAGRTLWNSETYWSVRRIIREHRFKVMHCNNTFPLLSPAIYHAAKIEGAAVVLTLHNYRLLCLNAYFLSRYGQVCEDCLDQSFAWHGVIRACYRQSRAASLVTACMLAFHRLLGTWQSQVDAHITLNEFGRNKFIKGGIPKDRVFIKPNFIWPDPGFSLESGSFALFVGRLSPEKGLFTMLQAWQRLDGIPLRIVGDGPLRKEVQAYVENNRLSAIEFMGYQDHDHIFSILKRARFLVFPSTWYECSPVIINEAFACGVPVVASRLGAMAEIIADGRTGLHFSAGDPDDPAKKVEWAWTHPGRMAEMGLQARKEYEQKYTAERNYEMLMEIYKMAMTRP
jgi:glycosyltransferase involved in cell wall biosynthesis